MRFFLKVIICLLLAAGFGTAYLAMRSGDVVYTFYEWLSPARFQQHDTLIRAAAALNVSKQAPARPVRSAKQETDKLISG